MSLRDVLFVLVTCTQEESRKAAVETCVQSINREHGRVPFEGNLVVFDNASVHKEPLSSLRAPAVYAMASENVGYWAALRWVMQNARDLMGREFAYIHPVESDFTLYQIERLAQARAFLASNQRFNTVRTQEFSVPWRFMYFKHRWNPFRVQRSNVANTNVVTGERVRFERAPGFDGIYLTNWHAKVPALHKLAPMQSTFEELAKLPVLTEPDFMAAMHKRHPGVAILDGGIWWMDLANPAKGGLTGSYSDATALAQHNYRNSRRDFIPAVMPRIDVQREALQA